MIIACFSLLFSSSWIFSGVYKVEGMRQSSGRKEVGLSERLWIEEAVQEIFVIYMEDTSVFDFSRFKGSFSEAVWK